MILFKYLPNLEADKIGYYKNHNIDIYIIFISHAIYILYDMHTFMSRNFIGIMYLLKGDILYISFHAEFPIDKIA